MARIDISQLPAIPDDPGRWPAEIENLEIALADMRRTRVNYERLREDDIEQATASVINQVDQLTGKPTLTNETSRKLAISSRLNESDAHREVVETIEDLTADVAVYEARRDRLRRQLEIWRTEAWLSINRNATVASHQV